MTKNKDMNLLIEDTLQRVRPPVPTGDMEHVLGYLNSIGLGIVDSLGTRQNSSAYRMVFYEYVSPVIGYCARYVESGSRREVLALLDKTFEGLRTGIIRRLTTELTREAERRRVKMDAKAVGGTIDNFFETKKSRGLVHSA